MISSNHLKDSIENSNFTDDSHGNKSIRMTLLKLWICAVLFSIFSFPIRSVIQFKVAEEQISGTYVGTLSGIDQHGTYCFSPSCGWSPLFLLNQNTGDITTAVSIDLEDLSSPIISMTLNGSDSQQVNYFQVIKVEILDINDNAPTFTFSKYTIVVSEGLGPQTFDFPIWSDADSGENGKLKHVQIVNLPDQSWPFIPEIEMSGNYQKVVLKITQSLDREERASYSFDVMIEDKGHPPLSGSIQITIEVQDKNDNSPVFEMVQTSFHVYENVSIPHFITKILATDADSGENGRLVYSVSYDYNIDYLSINQNTGDISLDKEIDYESCPIIPNGVKGLSFTVSVHDMGQPQRISLMDFELIINDVNDNYPSIQFFNPFMTTENQVELQENLPARTYTATIIVSDRDSGENGEFDVSVDDGGTGDFEVEDKDGYLVLTTGNLDREENALYSLVISAADKGSPSLTKSKVLTVVVLDSNDNAPQFEKDYYSTTVSENVLVDSFIMSVEAADPDFGVNGSVKYEIISQSRGNSFKISPSGRISSMSLLDAEDAKYHVLNISAYDGGTPSLLSYVLVNITVLDVNDNYPIFSKSLYKCQVSESVVAGSTICSVKATDMDGGINGQIEYSIQSEGQNSNIFAIDGDGVVTLATFLDYETEVSHKLIVMATDKGKPTPLFSTTELIITVTDVNDEAPVFDPSTYNIAVPADMIFTKIVQLHVSDKDEDDTVTFSLLGNGADFAVSSSGMISNFNKLNYSGGTVHLQVDAVDKMGNKASIPADVQIQVLENTDDLPIFPDPIFEVSVSEDFAVGQVIASTIATTRSVCTINYSIDSTSQFFTIDATSGELTLMKSLDFESKRQFSVPITASCHSTDGHVIVEITILDVNDNWPSCDIITDSYVKEDAAVGSTIHALVCSDKDSDLLGELSYSIDAPSHFTIDASNGNVNLVSQLDRETQNLIPVTFLVCDNDDTNQKCINHLLNFHVMDVNDNVPQFLEPLTFYVSEDVKVNHDVGKLLASDADEGANSNLIFTLLNSVPEFSVFGSGQIVVNKVLDYETIDRFFLNVRVSDQGNPSLHSDEIVTIVIQDANDNPPEFEEDSYSFDVTENIAIPHTFGSVHASDEDTGDNGKVAYSLANDFSHFTIDLSSGQLSLTKEIDFEGPDKVYELTVEAFDNGVIPLKSLITVRVNVVDVNDNSPMFSQKVYVASINENVRIGYSIIQVFATDRDGPSNNQIEYTVLNHEDKFRIDPVNGYVFSTSSFDFEVQQSFNVTLQATDNGNPSLSSVVSLVVSLIDVNDNAPVFGSSVLQLGVVESTQPSTVIKTVHATDLDSGDNGRIVYAIVSESDPGYFFLESDSGDLTLLRKLSYSEKVFNLTISASDYGTPQQSSTQNIRITVIDVNDNAPVFTDSITVFDVSENLVADIYLFTVSASDQDSGAAGIVNFNISSAYLKIGISNGEVYSADPIDRESIQTFKTQVCAIDQASPASEQLSKCKDITINVLDVNDNAPQFVHDGRNVFVSESVKVGESFSTINASDADLGLNSSLLFTIVDQSPSGMVSIDPQSGILSLLQTVDYEVSSFLCSLTVEVSDQGIPALHSVKQFDVLVTDHNDNVPSFNNAEGRRAVFLSSSVRSGDKIFEVSTTDLDSGRNGQVSYSISTGSDGFSIDRDSGAVVILFDVTSSFSPTSLRVKATDLGTPSLHSSMLISIEYRPENSDPVCPKEISISVPENTVPFSTLHQIDCYDLDWGERGSLFYEILDGDLGGHFIIRDSGEVVLNSRVLDFEGIELYSLIVLAKDRGRPSLKTKFHFEIKVTNVNDESPKFDEEEVLINLKEDATPGSLIETFVATDVDGDNLLYSIDSVSQFCQNYFSMNEQTGQLTLSTAIDDEFMKKVSTSEECTLSVAASDGIFVAHSSVLISVEDVDNSEPVFYSSPSFVSKLDSTGILGAVGATDKDIGDINLQYSLVSSSKRATDFVVDQESGVISCPDLSCSSATVVVKASGRTLSTDKSITIDISDASTADVFPSAVYSFTVQESVNIGFILGEIDFVNEPDMIKIESGNKMQSFELESSNLVVKNTLDYELVSSYNLTLCATSQGISYFATAYITIADVNDNAPIFLPSIVSVHVSDTVDVGTKIFEATATDKDSDLSGEVLYYIKDSSANEFFRIDTTSGEVFSKQTLLATPDVVNVYIKAKDQGVPVQTSNELSLKVYILHQPVVPKFESSAYEFSTYANAAAFSVVGQVVVEDDIDNDYRYDFESTNDHFAIYPVSGKIIQKGPINAAESTELVMKVKAFSNSDPSVYSLINVNINVIPSICNSSPCLNDGVCVDHVESYECLCKEGTIGRQCECEDSACSNNGFCSYDSLIGTTQCLCSDGSSHDDCGGQDPYFMIAIIAGVGIVVVIIVISVVMFCIVKQRKRSKKKSAVQEFDEVVRSNEFVNNKRAKGQLQLKESICLNPITVSSLDKLSQNSNRDYGYTNHNYDLDSPLAMQQLSATHSNPHIFDYAASDSGQSSQCTEAVIFNKLQQVDEPSPSLFQRKDKDSGLAGSLNTLCHFDTDLNHETYTQDYLHDWGPKVQNLVNVLDLNEEHSDEDGPIKEEFV